MSLFDLNREQYPVRCSCGQVLAKIGPPVKNQHFLEYECPYCGHGHTAVITVKELAGSEPVPLVCPELEMPAAFIGLEKAVVEAFNTQDRSLEEVARELGFVDYFENPEIMYEVLGHLYQIADGGNLSCSCGNYYIEVEISSDRVELRCKQCGAVAVVSASTSDDLKTVRRMLEIKLAEGRNNRLVPPQRSLRE